MKQNSKIKALFKKVKLLLLDVDGVLTNGEIIYDDKGHEFKNFNVKDGLGVYLLGKLGIKTVIITAKNSKVVKRRAKDMKVSEVIGNILPKEGLLGPIVKKYKVKKKEICFIGDDLIDRELIRKVGVGVAPKDAHPQVKKYAEYVTKKGGGKGAVREVVDLIIKAKGLEGRLSQWLKKPS